MELPQNFEHLSLMSALDELHEVEGEADVRAQPLKRGSLDLLSPTVFASRLIYFPPTVALKIHILLRPRFRTYSPP